MSTNIYSHIPIIKSPEELEKVLPGLREFVENYEPDPNDAPSAGWGGYHPTIHTPEMYAENGRNLRGRKISEEQKQILREYMTNRVVTEETRQKLSNYWKSQPPLPQCKNIIKNNNIKHHCPIHDKWMNIGNLMRHHRECLKQERSTIIHVENESMY